MKPGIRDTDAVSRCTVYRRIVNFVLRTGGLCQKWGRITGNPPNYCKGTAWIAYPVRDNDGREANLLVLEDANGSFHRFLLHEEDEL